MEIFENLMQLEELLWQSYLKDRALGKKTILLYLEKAVDDAGAVMPFLECMKSIVQNSRKRPGHRYYLRNGRHKYY